MDITITNVNKLEKYYEIEINNGDVKFFVPYVGENIDLIRSKVQVVVPKKYTALDIHIIQEKVFKMLVETDYTEVEQLAKYKQGVYKPSNPEKWVGGQIIYRSSWELYFNKWADRTDNVLKVASEEFFIPYFYEPDQKWHKYFPDYIMEYVDKNKDIKKVVVEIKPYSETIPPKRGKKREKTFINEVLTYEKNHAKWTAAKKFCEENNMKFIVLTEYELGIK